MRMKIVLRDFFGRCDSVSLEISAAVNFRAMNQVINEK